MEIDGNKVVMLFENPYIYDGWSVKLTEDGKLHNRWDKDDPRYAPTEAFIKDLEEQN